MIEDRGEVAVENRKPVATVDLADFENRTPKEPKRDDLIRARGVLYKIHSVQPDDGRQAVLILKKASNMASVEEQQALPAEIDILPNPSI